MTYTVIETFAPETHLVEDIDGIRLLLVPGLAVGQGVWVGAHSQGVSAIVVDGSGWISTEHFMDKRASNEMLRRYEIGVDDLSPLPDEPEPSYISMRQSAPEPEPGGSSGFVSLHCHSEFSPLDGLSTLDEMVAAVVADDQPAVALTDHGYCSGHPALAAAAASAGIKPIFGIEAYFVPNRHARGPGKLSLGEPPAVPAPFAGTEADFLLHPRGTWTDSQRERVREWEAEKRRVKQVWEAGADEQREAHKKLAEEARDYEHLVLWAETDEGLRNLWAMSTLGFLEGFYSKPRIDWEVLERYQTGVMASTACLRGPVAHQLQKGRPEVAEANLGRLLGIFGDRLYVELHTNGLDIQRDVNTYLAHLADKQGIPTIAVVDSHYPCHDDQHAHKVWLAAQTNSDLADDGDLFAGHQDYHMMTAAEVREALDYLPRDLVDESMANTLVVADRASASLTPRRIMPIFTRPGTYPDEKSRRAADLDRLLKLALGTAEDGYANWVERCEGKDDPIEAYRERFEREMDLIVSKDFVGYFLMVWEQVHWAKSQGCLVGPGRGSGGGCLVAYLLRITEMDPVKDDLLFERFLTEGRDEPPDFDVDYPTSWRDRIQDWNTERWGEEHTVRVGTHSRLQSRGVFQDLARVFRDEVDYKDFLAISKLIERAEAGSAGLGLSWEDLWAQHGDELEPYEAKYPEVFALAERLRGRVKTYAKHAAGLVISPDEALTDSLPLRMSDNSTQPITQFDMDALTMLGYIKFDILTLRTLDTLQQCIDLIEQRRGERIDVYSWRSQYDDPQVWDEICDGRTKGIFQIETPDGTRMTRRFKPRSVADLADVITLVRPGPKRSGLTDAYLRRRDGFEEVSIPDPRLAEVLAPTQGAIIYQEQVMQTCQILAGYSLAEADGIRKILGKKQVEKIEAVGHEFVGRCVERGMERPAAEHLWAQLGEFAKYGFNKSHAFAYAYMGFWTAWFKFHFPVEFLTAILSTVKKERIPEFVAEARRMDYAIQPPDINESAGSFTAGEVGCRYGFSGIDGIGSKVVDGILAGQPYASFDDFMERKGPGVNADKINRMAKLGVFDSIEPNRKALIARLEWEESEEATRCQHKVDGADNHGLPCGFDWDSEPVVIGKSGRPLKRKPPPKRCTKACRQYIAPEPPDFDALGPVTDAEIRDAEMEFLGVHLTSTPFDRIPDEMLLDLALGSEVESGPTGTYRVAGLVSTVRPHRDRNGNPMGFVKAMVQDTELDMVVFSATWSRHSDSLKPGMLFLADISKNPRGMSLGDQFIPLPEGP